MKLSVYNKDKVVVSDCELSDEIFAQPVRLDILSRVIEWQLAKRRSGNHKTKLIQDISGSTKKIVRQKGTGGARHGSRRAGQFRGGSVIFGPVVRSHAYSLPKKVRKLGLRVALSSKLASNELIILENGALDSVKTKNAQEFMARFETNSLLLIDGESVDMNMALASRGIPHFDVLPQIGANVYDIMRHEKVILTLDALKALEERLKCQ